MKRIVSSGLWVFLVLGAAALLSGGSSPAAADHPTSPWTGQWSCAFQDYNNLFFDHVRAEGILHMTGNDDGTVDVSDWITYQHFTDEVVEMYNTYSGVIVEESFPTIEVEFPLMVEGEKVTLYGRCLGNLYDKGTQTFTGATCNTWGKWKDRAFVEQSTCVRTFKPLPRMKKHPK